MIMQAHVNTEYYKTALVAIDHIDRLVEHKEIPIESIRYNLEMLRNAVEMIQRLYTKDAESMAYLDRQRLQVALYEEALRRAHGGY